MWSRLLLAIDQYESGQTALAFTAGLAIATDSNVRVLHLRELALGPRVPPLETPNDAQLLVDGATLSLRLAGVGAEGQARSVRADRVAHGIVEESVEWRCDAIVLGSRRLRGVDRLSGRGVREHVLRLSSLPVITAPPAADNGVHSPAWLRRGMADRREAGMPLRPTG
jgi:nucleotide-binding universal stress UspA family protein